MEYKRNVMLVGGPGDGKTWEVDVRENFTKIMVMASLGEDLYYEFPVPSPEMVSCEEAVYQRTVLRCGPTNEDPVIFYRKYGMSTAEAVRRLIQFYIPKSK